MTDLSALLERLRAATGGGRPLDRALAFVADVGTDLERAVYAEMGDAAFVPDQHGLSPMDYKNGDIVRQEWVKGTRMKPGGYKPRIWLNCNGPRPLRSAPAYTTSLDAALALVRAKLPGWEWVVAQHSGKCWACVQPGGQDEFGGPEHVEHPGEAATPALSLLVALLVALIAEQTSDAL